MSSLIIEPKRIDPKTWRGYRSALRQQRDEIIGIIPKIREQLEEWIKARDTWKADPLTDEIIYAYVPPNDNWKPSDPLEIAIKAFNGDRLSFFVNSGEAILRVRKILGNDRIESEGLYTEVRGNPGDSRQGLVLWRREGNSDVGTPLADFLQDWEQSVFHRTMSSDARVG